MKTIFVLLITCTCFQYSWCEIPANRNARLAVEALPVMVPQWNTVGLPFVESVESLVQHGSDVYACGWFHDAGGNPDADYIARWDGCEWHAVIPGLDGCVNEIAFFGPDIYVGGCFTGYAAKWNGSVLDVLEGLNETVVSIDVNSTGVYAGGYFTNASGQPNADGIARWNGSSWESMGTGISLNENYLEIHTSPNGVWIGGDFLSAGGVANTLFIAFWNGNVWQSVGGGLTGFVSDMQLAGNDIYVAGDFYDAGGIQTADKIARWDGSSWHSIGDTDGFSTIYSMFVGDTYTYVAGVTFGGLEFILQYYTPGNTWEGFPELPQYYSGGFHTLLEINDELYACGGYQGWWGTAIRWGEPGLGYEISGVPFFICQDAPPINLPTVLNGITGNWSGEGVLSNIFYPDDVIGYIPLTFNPTPGQCVYPLSTEVWVYLEEIEYQAPPTFCESSPPVSLLPFQFGVTGTWSGPGVNNNYFNPAGLVGFHTLTFTPDPGECTAVAQLYLQVELSIVPGINGVPSSICALSAPINLPTLQSGILGNWSGEGVNNNFFDPAGLAGDILLTFTPNPQYCATENTISIDVVEEILVQLSGIPDTVCQLATPITLPTTQSGVNGNWSGPGVINNFFNPANQNGIVNILFLPALNTCAYPANESIYVFIEATGPANIPTSVCEDNPPISLPTILNGINGNWSGPGVVNNIFQPWVQQGNIQLVFTPQQGECAYPLIQAMYVNSLLEPVITGIPFEMCSEDDPILLPVNMSGVTGHWSGNGVINNSFEPAGLSGYIDLTFIPNAGQCASPAITSILIHMIAPPVLENIPVTICSLAMPVNLPVIQSGVTGNWSGMGVTNNVFDPNGLLGTIELTFSPYAGQCAEIASSEINVVSTYTPQITGVPAHVCENLDLVLLPILQENATGIWSGNGVVNNTFSPAGIPGSVLLLFTPDTLQCAVPSTWTITVDTLIATVLDHLPGAVCQRNEFITLDTIQSGIVGSWTGDGVVSDTLYLANLVGEVNLNFSPQSNQCALPVNGFVLVDTIIHPLLNGIPDSVCQTDGAFELPTIQGGIPGKWEGPGVEENIFYPDSLFSLQTISFLSQNGACKDTSSALIFVHESPDVLDVQIHCDTSINSYSVSFTLSGGDSTGYYVDGFLLNGNGFVSQAIPYSQPAFSFSIEDNRGCGPVAVNGVNTCLCTTYSGTMPENAILVCMGHRIQVTHQGDAQPDPDDALTFVMHNQNGNSLGHIFSISATGQFSFLPGMLLNHPYYISVIAGNQTGNGEVDFNDPCLSVSNGMPVIFYQCRPDDQNTPHSEADGFDFTGQGITNRSINSVSDNESTGQQIISISLFDIVGRKLWKKTNPGISVAELKAFIFREVAFPAGSYFYTIETMDRDGRKFQMQYRVTCVRE